MAINHTLLLALRKSSSVNHFVRLDEGHDRPVWEDLKSGTRLIPSSSERIVLGGVILLAYSLGINSKLNDLLRNVKSQNILIDLTLLNKSENLQQEIKAVLADYHVQALSLNNKRHDMEEIKKQLSLLGID